ncbi:MAG: HAD-IC family P-type ATPase [Chloroflexota bacterium]
MVAAAPPPAPAPEAAFPPTPAAGLTAAEAAARAGRGFANTGLPKTGRTYWQIVKDNLLTFINVSLIGVGLVLIGLGQVKEAVLSAGLVVLNAIVGIVQEAIAKRRLDQIALLNQAQARVIRDGREVALPPEQIVVGDVLAIGPGDQVFVDGPLRDGAATLDESLLTGEADPIPKRPGDRLSSGSFCVSGDGRYVADRVGARSTAAAIAAEARAFKTSLTPLQHEVNRIVRLLLAVAGFFLVMILVGSILHGYPLQDTVLAAAVVLGIVPSGLFLMIVVTYSMAIVRLARRDALIQQVNAVESLSNVDIFCMDKTGTLTANAIDLREIRPIGGAGEQEIRAALGDFARSASGGTRTSDALVAACPGQPRPLTGEIPFSSARKWSAVASQDGPFAGTWAMGAPEFLGKRLDGGGDLAPPDGWTEQGWRVLLWAHSPDQLVTGPDGEPDLPPTMEAAAWLGFVDQLRPRSREALEGFREAGIQLKIISGDNPETVAALARQAGLPADARLVSGLDLAAMSEAEFAEAAAGATVFGRVTPEQKQHLVEALREQGNYVAMTGDGVNDVLSLKQADLGIAMQSGSQATRNAADIVLLNDSFAALPLAFQEGQRIRRGLLAILQLFLTRVFAVALIILAVLLVEAGFPFSPGHLSLLTILTVGIPTFGLALWAQPGQPIDQIGRALARFVVPAASTLATAAFIVYLIIFAINQYSLPESTVDGGVIATSQKMFRDDLAREGLTHTLVLGGLILVLFAAPPTRWFAVVEEPANDWKPAILALLMVPLYGLVLIVPRLRAFFDLQTLNATAYLVIGAIVLAWTLLVRFIWITGSFGRYFGYDDSRED